MIEKNKVYCMDAFELLKQLPDKLVDLVLIDPPYNIGIDEWDKREDYLHWMEKNIEKISHITKDGVGQLYLFGSKDFIAELKILCNKYDFDLVSWNIWNKGTKSQNAVRSYADITEHCLFFVKSKRPFLNKFSNFIKEARLKKGYTTLKCRELIGLSIYKNCGNAGKLWFETGRIPNKETYTKIKNILDLDNSWNWIIEDYTFNESQIRIKRDPKEKRIFKNEKQIARNIWYSNNKMETQIANHPTIKPLELIEMIIKASSNKGDVILDCFVGSGTTAVACKKLNRNFICCDNNADYVKIANKRLAQQSVTDFTSASPTLAEPKEFNKDLTATQQVATPKSASQTSLNPNIKTEQGGKE